MTTDMILEAWTDGSCSAKDRVGGWGSVIMPAGIPGFAQEISGWEKDTTSQRMELTAFLRTLQHFPKPVRLVVYSDSAYLINCLLEKWMVKWEKNGWTSSKNEPVKNKDLWQAIAVELERHISITPMKVKGHRGIEFNERADVLAGEARALALTIA